MSGQFDGPIYAPFGRPIPSTLTFAWADTLPDPPRHPSDCSALSHGHTKRPWWAIGQVSHRRDSPVLTQPQALWFSLFRQSGRAKSLVRFQVLPTTQTYCHPTTEPLITRLSSGRPKALGGHSMWYRLIRSLPGSRDTVPHERSREDRPALSRRRRGTLPERRDRWRCSRSCEPHR